MESIRARYRELTGEEPGDVVIIQNGFLEKFIDEYLAAHGSSRELTLKISDQEEFLDVLRTSEGYIVKGLVLNKNSRGSPFETYFEERRIPEGELGESLRRLEVGDSLTLHLIGNDTKDIIRKRASYLHSERGEYPSPLGDEGLREIIMEGDSSRARLIVENARGIHARLAAAIVKFVSSLDKNTEVYLTKSGGSKVSCRSIMGILTLDAPKDTPKDTPIGIIARGPDSRKALEGLINLFDNRFGEEQ